MKKKTIKKERVSGTGRDQHFGLYDLVDLTTMFPSDTRLFKNHVFCSEGVYLEIERASRMDSVDVGTYVWDTIHMAWAELYTNLLGRGDVLTIESTECTGSATVLKCALVTPTPMFVSPYVTLFFAVQLPMRQGVKPTGLIARTEPLVEGLPDSALVISRMPW